MLTGSTSTGVETDTDNIALAGDPSTGLSLGTETTKVFLKLETTLAHDANVTSSFYRCVISFE